MRYFIVERARTARRYIKATNPPFQIDELNIIEFDKTNMAINTALTWLKSGYDVGVISESGMPGIADPGSEMVRKAHDKGFKVSSLVGPSSILLAISASGLNGQSFCFNGYLPIKETEIRNQLRRIENEVLHNNQTHVFIETPYRNDRLLGLLCKLLPSHLKLCVARDISGQEEFILTKSISEWNKVKDFIIGKYPTIFLIGK